VKIDGIDLLKVEWPKAERVLAAKLPKQEALVAAKIGLRRLRTFADICRLEQEVVASCYVVVQDALDAFSRPLTRAPASGEITPPGAVEQPNPFRLAEDLLQSQRKLTQARQHLIRTWIDHQAARLELYRLLGHAGIETQGVR
jgi:hypothetical protein